jgi:hypothetical protein
MFLLISLPICLFAVLVLFAAAFADVALGDRHGAATRGTAKLTGTHSPAARTAKTPIFVPSAMHACDSVRVVWY